jgi:hypothetical protein
MNGRRRKSRGTRLSSTGLLRCRPDRLHEADIPSDDRHRQKSMTRIRPRTPESPESPGLTLPFVTVSAFSRATGESTPYRDGVSAIRRARARAWFHDRRFHAESALNQPVHLSGRIGVLRRVVPRRVCGRVCGGRDAADLHQRSHPGVKRDGQPCLVSSEPPEQSRSQDVTRRFRQSEQSLSGGSDDSGGR